MRQGQLNLEGATKTEVAISRIQGFEPPEGYYLAFSGGKDSITIYDLAVKAGVRFDAHYNMTGIDPPELVQFIRANYPLIEMHRPIDSMWNLIHKNGLPTRQARWCCEILKEGGGSGRYVLTGIRWAESANRKRRMMTEICKKDKTKIFVHPIIDWSWNDVWDYIRLNGLKYCSLYDEGFKRLGCILCPMISKERSEQQMERWPKIAEAWKRATFRYWSKQNEGQKRFPTPESYWEWWLSRARWNYDKAQCIMFDN
jgi:phosphoadenosine phosphosulfate reductase